MTVRPTFRPPPAERDLEAGTLVLRDGSRRPLWRVLPEDVNRIEAFFRSLAEGEREEVLESLGLEPGGLDAFIESLSGGQGGEAFLVEAADEDRVVAFGAYRLSSDQGDATLALAVAPDHRGAGIGGLLLERLAILAAHRGVDRLIGRALPANEPLVQLFRDSGLDVEEERDGDRVTLITDIRSAVPETGEERLRGMGSRVFTAGSLRPLFFPRTVAVIGASRDPASVGHRILQGLVTGGFQGTVFPVNPKADQVLSIKAYPSIEAIGEPVDLAVIAIPAPAVPDVIDACGEVGVRGLVVVTAGFAETGEEGRARQRELLERARAHRMRMVGPNCLGLLQTDPDVRLNASFAPVMPPAGSVALCSQSGALGIAIIALARRIGLGLSSFVSVGNKADVAADDLLEYWEEDASTDVLLFYLESFARPRRFARIARRVGRRKPIVVVKSGRTAAGERAAGSHTAALTAAETAVEALFHQTGIVRADTLEEMFGIARALTDLAFGMGGIHVEILRDVAFASASEPARRPRRGDRRDRPEPRVRAGAGCGVPDRRRPDPGGSEGGRSRAGWRRPGRGIDSPTGPRGAASRSTPFQKESPVVENHRLAPVVESATVGFFVMRSDEEGVGRFVYVNPCFAEIFGYDRDEMIGRSPLSLVAPPDRDRIASELQQRFAGEVPAANPRFRGLRKDGETIRVEVHGSRAE